MSTNYEKADMFIDELRIAKVITNDTSEQGYVLGKEFLEEFAEVLMKFIDADPWQISSHKRREVIFAKAVVVTILKRFKSLPNWKIQMAVKIVREIARPSFDEMFIRILGLYTEGDR